MINLSLDRFRRGNYNLEKQQPEMNNSYSDKMVHQLPGTFTAQLCSVFPAVKRMHHRGDGCEIKVGFHKMEILRRHGFHSSHTVFTAFVKTATAKQGTAHLTGRLWCLMYCRMSTKV